MSKIGKQPITLPQGVTLVKDGSNIKVTGPKGALERKLPVKIDVQVNGQEVSVITKSQSDNARAMHGTTRALIANMVKGVDNGWTKTLELVGTGYRAEVAGNTLSLNIGYSHPVKITAPEGISFKVEKTDVTVEGTDKELVGQISATIRSKRPPEPYKGKGIRYKGEVIRRKAGKAAKAQAG